MAGNTAATGPDVEQNGVLYHRQLQPHRQHRRFRSISATLGNIINPANADLGTLANNGGINAPDSVAAPFTVALLTGSPAASSGGPAT